MDLQAQLANRASKALMGLLASQAPVDSLGLEDNLALLDYLGRRETRARVDRQGQQGLLGLLGRPGLKEDWGQRDPQGLWEWLELQVGFVVMTECQFIELYSKVDKI